MNKLINTSELSRLFTGSRTSIQSKRIPSYVEKLTAKLIAEAQIVERFAEIHKLYTAKQPIPYAYKNDFNKYLYLIGAKMLREDELGLARLLEDDITVEMCQEYLDEGCELYLWKINGEYGIEIVDKDDKCAGVMGLGYIIKNNPSFIKVAKLTSKIINKYKN